MLHSSLLAVFAVSLFSLVAVSIDRCWAVCYPVTYHIKSTTTTKIIIACCWVLGIFFGSLPTLGWNRASFDNKCDYRVVTDLNNLMLVCAAIAFLSTLAIAVLYLLVYCEILKQVSGIAPKPRQYFQSYYFHRVKDDKRSSQILWNRRDSAKRFEQLTR